MPKKPKGWFHRYELIHRPVRFRPDEQARDWWCIVHYYGRGSGAGVRYLDHNCGPDISDEDIIRRTGTDSVTVPVYVVRNDQASGPYFGKYYGQK
jgi:hypothetical protein